MFFLTSDAKNVRKIERLHLFTLPLWWNQSINCKKKKYCVKTTVYELFHTYDKTKSNKWCNCFLCSSYKKIKRHLKSLSKFSVDTCCYHHQKLNHRATTRQSSRKTSQGLRIKKTALMFCLIKGNFSFRIFQSISSANKKVFLSLLSFKSSNNNADCQWCWLAMRKLYSSGNKSIWLLYWN